MDQLVDLGSVPATFAQATVVERDSPKICQCKWGNKVCGAVRCRFAATVAQCVVALMVMVLNGKWKMENINFKDEKRAIKDGDKPS
jgi:hypothetical protein